MLAPRASALLALGGCLSSTYRYVDVPGPAAQVREQLEQRSRDEGFRVRRHGDTTHLQEDTPSDDFPLPAKRPPWTAVRFHELDPERTRIELASGGAAGGNTRAEGRDPRVLLPDGPEIRVAAKEPFGWSESYGMGIEPMTSFGVVRDPEFHASRRFDGAVRISRRLHRFGQVDDATRTRWSVVATPGLGVRVSSELIAFRPELLVGLAHQPAAWFVPGRQIPTGPRTLFDLSLAGLIEQHGRRGLEVGVSVRNPAWGGFYVRAGVMSGAGSLRGGPIVSAGIEAGTIPSLLLSWGMIALLAGVSAAADKLGVPSGEP